ncbi:MAG: Hyperpolarization-activated voltage-gated potassium channel [Euryarchaeota archaeon ADurb.Bin190]|nr:MAG: Hyperpolarization-activated voltage-gated potassium channel [Euryarchaeota archaeon ADurb.Bin190]
MPGLKAARQSNIKNGRSFRETVQFYMIDFKTPLGRAIDIIIIALNLIAVSIFVLHTYDLSSAQQEMLWRLEIAVVAVFIMEYALRLYGAPDRGKHLKDAYSMIDLAAILPTLIIMVLPASFFVYDIRFIQILRVLTVFRIFRFLRFVSKSHMLFGTISQGKINIARLVFSIIIFFFVYSGIFYFVESPLNPKVNNFGDAFYFIVVAVSTVGFGDIVPVTGIGKLVTVVMIISGIILIPFQAARIFRAWMASDRERKVQICPGCGLDRHDADARYCKACGEALPGDR